MEERKSIKISLSTFFLLIAIIVIIAMAYYIYIEKTNYNKEIANITNTTPENNHQEIANITNSISENNYEQNTSNQLSDSEVDKIAIDLFEKGSKKIRETQYTDYFEYDIVIPMTEKIINGVRYIKRDILYSDVEKEYSEIFTGEALKKVLGKRFLEVDGYLYVSNGGATGWNVTNIKVSRLSKSNSKIEYIVTYNDVRIDDSISEEYSCKMTIELVDDNYRISETNYCNLDQNN